jgi:hypothetical protein
MKHILDIEGVLNVDPSDDFRITRIGLFDNHNLLDGDLIFWNPSVCRLPSDANKVTKKDVDRIKIDLERLRLTFDEYFQMGRILVLNSPMFATRNYVLDGASINLSFSDALPIPLPSIRATKGTNTECAQEGDVTQFFLHNICFHILL